MLRVRAGIIDALGAVDLCHLLVRLGMVHARRLRDGNGAPADDSAAASAGAKFGKSHFYRHSIIPVF